VSRSIGDPRVAGILTVIYNGNAVRDR